MTLVTLRAARSGAARGTALLERGLFVEPALLLALAFDMSTVQTFYGTLTGGSRLNPLGDAGDERAPMIAWLRLWVYGDDAAKKYFYGDDCICCKAPWVMAQRKNWP